jgi:hypothetical protein
MNDNMAMLKYDCTELEVLHKKYQWCYEVVFKFCPIRTICLTCELLWCHSLKLFENLYFIIISVSGTIPGAGVDDVKHKQRKK